MTVEELAVFNSTLPAGEGWTFLDHLLNVKVNREVIGGVDIDVTPMAVTANIVDGTVMVGVVDHVLEIDVIDGIITVNIDDEVTGVEYD